MASQTKRITLFLNGKDVEGTIGNLRKKSRELNNEINQLTPGTKKYLAKIKQLKSVNKDLDVHNSKIKKVNKGFSGIGGLVKKIGPVGLAIGVATGAAVAFGKKSVDAFRKQAKAIAKVEQAIKSTGGAARLSSKQLQAEASALQKSSLFGDEDILNGVTAQLLTFTNIAGDEFKRTQKVALDLSTVLDTDLKSSSLQLGKALNDPVAGLSALSRSGIQFSAEQKAVIKSLADTNQIAEAQNVILNELERQYGGQAQAAAEADGGFEQLGNQVGDLFEQIGELLLPALKSLVNGFKGAVNWIQNIVTAFKEWDMDSLKAGILSFYDTVTFGLIPGLTELSLKAEVYAATQRRIRASVDEATDSINSQGKEFNTLIEVVKSSNTTDEQKAEAIDQLNSKYGELIGEVDLTGASLEELNRIQDNTNKKIIETTIARQKQIEFEKALQLQIKSTQDILVGNQDFGTRAFLSTEDFDKLQSKLINDRVKNISSEFEAKTEALNVAQEKLLELEKNGGGLKNFGSSITLPDEIIADAKKNISSFTSELSRLVGSDLADKIAAGGKESKEAFQEALDLVGNDQKIVKLKAALEANNNVIEESRKTQAKALGEVVGIGATANAAVDKTVSGSKKKADSLIKELDKLRESVAKFQKEAANAAALDDVNDAQEKELLKLEQTIEKKYEKEIASAEKLAKSKGNIGQEAQEQLDAILLVKSQEFERAKLDIVEKFEEEKQKAIIAADAENKEFSIEAERANLSTRLLEATLHAGKVSDAEVAVQKAAIAEVNEARKALLDFEKDQSISTFEAQKDARIEALKDQLDNELITEQEYKDLKFEQEQLFLDQKKAAEIQSKEELDAIDEEFTEKELERKKKVIANISNAANLVFDSLNKINEIQTNNELNRSDEITEKKISDLEREKAKGEISEEKYAEKKAQIEAEGIERTNAIKNKAAKKQRESDLLEAKVKGALAFIEALPKPLLMATAAVSSAIQIGLIKSTPIPQFKKGGKRTPVVGADDNKTYNAEYLGRHPGGMLPSHPSLVLASEVGPEYYVPSHLLNNPVVANHVGVIEAIRSGRQMAAGGYTGEVNQVQAQATASSQRNDAVNAQMVSVLARMTAQLESGLSAKIGDSAVDQITDKQNEIAEIKG